MDIKLSEEQVQLKEGARKFMEDECTGEFVREMEKSELGYTKKMWQQMAEMGWLGMAAPEDCGGLELGTVDLVILAKELGRNICPSPFLSTVVIAGEAIARAGSDAQRQEFLPKIVEGELVLAFAYQEYTRKFEPGVIELQAKEDLVVARTSGEAPASSGLTMFLVDAKSEGIASKRTPTMARDHHYEVGFSGVRVPKDRVLGGVGDAWSSLEGVIEKAAVVFSGYTGGVCEMMHERATEYAQQRVQFDRPIGQMQLIQSYLATLIIDIYGSDTLTFFTAFNMDKGRRVRPYVAKTKAFAADTVNNTTNVGAQIFGGIGYMEEQDTTLYLRRGKQYQLALGGLDYWEDIIAEELIDVENPTLLT
ncbi:MAG: acyl-CoA/acyl-ACP dehydrogenase [Deltaproteobacteria bacterium]|nr:acyl-CoA/acyl-ACP dehydrogenase [Deltaproteobacteria bacterium]